MFEEKSNCNFKYSNFVKNSTKLSVAVNACNPSTLRGLSRRTTNLSLAGAEDMAQCRDPDFNPQYCQKKTYDIKWTPS